MGMKARNTLSTAQKNEVGEAFHKWSRTNTNLRLSLEDCQKLARRWVNKVRVEGGLDRQVVSLIDAAPCEPFELFDMNDWHLDAVALGELPENPLPKRYQHCGTTHCRAGWYDVVGFTEIQRERFWADICALSGWGSSYVDPEVLGAFVFLANYPDEPVPNFYRCSESEEVLEEMRDHDKQEKS